MQQPSLVVTSTTQYAMYEETQNGQHLYGGDSVIVWSRQHDVHCMQGKSVHIGADQAKTNLLLLLLYKHHVLLAMDCFVS